MATAEARSTPAARLGIGQVLSKLTEEFPGLTGSKLRFLEVQGIVTPARTASGYRKFSPEDVQRLRLALTLQRDHYLPLSVIREYLADVDAGRETSLPLPASMHSRDVRYTRAELITAAGASPRLLNEAVSSGLIQPRESYGEQTLRLLRALVALDSHGIEPRHIRGTRQAAEREVALVEAALGPLLKRADQASRARADELAPELASRLDEVRQLFMQSALERILSS